MVGKGKFAKDYSEEELAYAYRSMSEDITYKSMPNSLMNMFELSWKEYLENKFAFDGATFFPERAYSIWEWQSFMHDWLNSSGFVGYKIDYLFTLMMLTSRFHFLDIFSRCSIMVCFTWVNIARHKIRKSHVKLKNDETMQAIVNTVAGDLMHKLKSKSQQVK